MNKWATAGLSVGLSAALVACGGGGSATSSNSTTTTTPATSPVTTPVTTPATNTATGMTGIWNGTSTDGSAVRIVVMDDGQAWRWVVKDNNMVSASYGTASASGTQGTLNLSRFDSTGTRTAESVAVTFSAGVSFKTSAVTNFAYDASYADAPSLFKIVPSAAGQMLIGNTPITLRTDNPTTGLFGTLANSSTSACEYSGTLSANATGKNIFDVTLTPSGAACGITAGVTYKGIASYDPTTNDAYGRLYIAALNPAKDTIFAFYGIL